MAMLNNQMVPFRDGLYNRSPKSVNLKQIHLGILEVGILQGNNSQKKPLQLSSTCDFCYCAKKMPSSKFGPWLWARMAHLGGWFVIPSGYFT